MSARVLLFDLDGTLTDSKPGIVGCMRFALRQLGAPSPSDDLLATFIGPPLRHAFRALLGTSDTERIEEAIRLYRQRFAETGLYENCVYDGVPAMLEEARQVAQATYVATAKLTVYARRIVEHFGLDRHFTRVYGMEPDDRHDDKTHLLAHLLEAERIAPRDAVMIGDRAADIGAAKANGLRAIGVLWGYGSERELIDARPEALCRRPADLAASLSAVLPDQSVPP